MRVTGGRKSGVTLLYIHTDKLKFYINLSDVLCLNRDITLSGNCWPSLPIAFLIYFYSPII